MSTTAVQERFKTVRAEIDALNAKGALDKTGALRMAELVTEAQGIKQQMELAVQVGELDEWAGRTAGMLPLAAASGADVQSITPAGTTTIEKHAGAFRIAEDYGEGVFNPAIRSKTNTKEYRDAFRTYLRSIRGVPESAMRILQEGVDSAGGFLVPEDILNRVIMKEPTPTRVGARVTQLTTGRDALTIPKVNYTADDIYTTGIRVAWTGEIPASATASRVTDPVFGQERIQIYTAMLSIPITRDMIEDSSFPLVEFISGKFAETVELLRDNMIISGTGAGQPMGILTGVNAANTDPTKAKVIKTGVNGAFDANYAKIAAVAMDLPDQYDETAAWVFNKTSVAATLAQAQDSQKRPLWGTGLQDAGLEPGFRNRALIGYPVLMSAFMPNLGTGSNSMIFGDLSGYYLVNRVGFSVEVLREIYAETNQVLVLGRLRFGGKVAEPWRFRVLQFAT